MKDALTRSSSIKNYIEKHFITKEDSPLEKVKSKAKEKGLPDIAVPAAVGKLLYMIAKIHRPKRILEIGTLAGYSTLWLAKALPEDGELITLEFDSSHAAIARENTASDERITVMEGVASLILERMAQEKEEPFDLIFIDADKENYPLYLHWALKLSRVGTVILSDNVIPKESEIGKPDPSDIQACGIYQFNREMASHPQLESTIITTIVGEKGRVDGVGMSIVLMPSTFGDGN